MYQLLRLRRLPRCLLRGLSAVDEGQNWVVGLALSSTLTLLSRCCLIHVLDLLLNLLLLGLIIIKTIVLTMILEILYHGLRSYLFLL